MPAARALTPWIVVALAAGVRADGPAERTLTRPTLVHSSVGDVLVAPGLILVDPRDRSLVRGVLARPEALIGIHVSAGSEIELHGPRPLTMTLRAAGPLALGGVSWRRQVTITVGDGTALAAGVLAEPALVEGVALAIGEAAVVRGALYELDQGRSSLGAGTVARAVRVRLGAATVELEPDDRVSVLGRDLAPYHDGERLLVRLAAPRTVDGRFPARGEATWSLRTGRLVGYDSVLFYDSGEPMCSAGCRPPPHIDDIDAFRRSAPRAGVFSASGWVAR